MVISAYCETLHAHGARFWFNLLLVSFLAHAVGLYLLLADFKLENKIYQLPGEIEITLQTQLELQAESEKQVKEEPLLVKPPPVPAPPVSKPRKKIVTVKKISPKKVTQPVKKIAAAKPAASKPQKAIQTQKKQTAYLKPQVVSNFDNTKPFYPQAARRRGMEGEVLLNVVIGANGEVLKIKIKKSSGFRLLDNSAMQTVRNWKFMPARHGEDIVVGSLDVPVQFKLLSRD